MMKVINARRLVSLFSRITFWKGGQCANNSILAGWFIAILWMGLGFAGFAPSARGGEVIFGKQNPTIYWNSSTDSRAAGFYVKYGIAGTSTTNVINTFTATNLALTALTLERTNFIFVTCYDIYGNESAPSQIKYYYPQSIQITAPSIATQPSSVAAVQGASAAFSVTASGTDPLSYQWFKNGTAIAGATGSTLNLSSVQAANAGSYTVTVNNAAGTATSAVATLTVNIGPAITAQPASLAVAQGSNATFSVTASGTAPFSYQWSKNGTAIAGATGSIFSIINVQPTHAGAYSATVMNMAGTASSAAATLTVNTAPAITSQPVSVVTAQGSNVIFQVVASGAAPLAYQWYKNGTILSGAIGSTLNLSNVQSANAGSYTVSVINVAGKVGSAAATLTVNYPPAITTQPTSVVTVRGGNVSFRVIASGTAPLYYQWFKNGTLMSGATASTLSLSWVQAADAASYTVSVKNMVKIVGSTPATLTVNIAPAITVQPISLVVTQGAIATFRVTATGTAPLRYQWRKNSVNIANATNSSYILASAQSIDAGAYSVVITNIAGSVASTTATLTVNVSLNTPHLAKAAASKESGLVSEPSTTIFDSTNAAQVIRGPVMRLKTAASATSGIVFTVATTVGSSYIIQVSDDLKTWNTVATISSATSEISEFTDTDSINHRVRFYRAVIDPE